MSLCKFFKRLLLTKNKLTFFMWLGIFCVLTITYEWVDIYHSPIRFISKNVRIIDGDTIVLDGLHIRLKGIDTPEIKQQCLAKNNQYIDCGVFAKIKLAQIIGGKEVSCSDVGIDKYKRQLSYCYVNDKNINLELVKAGYAYSYMNNNPFLIYYEILAKISNKGLWNTHFEKPWVWRQLKRKKH